MRRGETLFLLGGDHMPKPRASFTKRQREQSKREKKQLKLEKRAARKNNPEEEPTFETPSESSEPPATSNES
jgi:hypothetical protein